MLQSKTEYIGDYGRNPQRSITLTMQPEIDLVPDWFSNQIGEVVHVDTGDWFLPYHRLDAFHWITKQTLKADDVGNWTCDLELEQVYGT
jgi:hypothetical protein